MITDRERLFNQIRELHRRIRAAVVAQTENDALEKLSEVQGDDSSYEGDTIFAIDKVSEELLIEFFEHEVAPERPLLLVAEGIRDTGLGEGLLALPRGISREDAQVIITVDPIDGTRCLMYQKRSAWILTGVAPNKGPETCLDDIEFALQTEIPLVKQHLADELWAFRGEGYHVQRFNRVSGEYSPVTLRRSHSPTALHGYAMITRFFPGVRDELAAIDEEVMQGALGTAQYGKALAFEDQYTASAGQLYELISGHDRFVADLRPLMEIIAERRGFRLGICAHPYDVCTALIAQEAGVILTDGKGQPLNPLLDIETNVSWAGFANEGIRGQIEPLLQAALQKRGLI